MNDFASSDTTGFGGKSTLFAFTITFSRRIFSWRTGTRGEEHGSGEGKRGAGQMYSREENEELRVKKQESPNTTHLRKSLSERSNTIENLVENNSEGPHIHLGANPRVVAETLRGQIPVEIVRRNALFSEKRHARFPLRN